MKFGILMERQAELLTDGLRALLLEASGYRTSVFEFISTEHTSKNIMIAAVKAKKPPDRAAALQQIAALKKAFGIAGYPEDVLEAKFGGMLRALSLGAPPHGGIAPGIDRIVMLLCGEENLREVVLFPMNQRAEDLMMGAPSEASPKQLRELHIRLNLPEKA